MRGRKSDGRRTMPFGGGWEIRSECSKTGNWAIVLR